MMQTLLFITLIGHLISVFRGAVNAGWVELILKSIRETGFLIRYIRWNMYHYFRQLAIFYQILLFIRPA